MKLKELLKGIDVIAATADLEMEIPHVRYDSRAVEAGDLFVAVTGYAVDGHKFIPSVMEKGAAAVICEREPEGEIPYVLVEDSRRCLAALGANFCGRPAEKMTMVAVTGTNGKTSTTYLLKAILEQARGAKVGLIGTNQNMIGDTVIPTERTTPGPFEAQELFGEMYAAGCTHVVMETSSHALVQGRIHGVHYDIGIFTNLTQDHLDYHKTFEAYRAAKKKLFYQTELAIVNDDDPAAAYMSEGLPCPVWTMGIYKGGDFYAKSIDITTAGASFHLFTPKGDGRVDLHISGLFSVYNAMGTAALTQAAGIPFPIIRKGLEELPCVVGRLQAAKTFGRPFAVYVDYAHTPDALKNVLVTARGFAKNRLISVFGCGGDRDHGKRPIMGEISGSNADFSVVTSDNPRSEDPMAIIDSIEEGIRRTAAPYVIIEDRRKAIHYALDMAVAGDVIVVAGKGHETYQEINGEKHHFDDLEIVEEYLREGTDGLGT